MEILVVPHDPGWAARFEREAKDVAGALGPAVCAIHHIGSTSIPGIYAKPIVDMLPVVTSLEEVDGANDAMRALGFEAMGEFGIPGRRYFRKNDEHGVRCCHVHAFVDRSPGIERHLAFRDYLRAHDDVAQEYSTLKRKLARAHPHDIEAYMAGKDPFIKDVERRALDWRRP